MTSTWCNCIDDPKWAVSDNGYLRDKDFLPVTVITGSDTGNQFKEWGSHTLGPLQCFQCKLYSYR